MPNFTVHIIKEPEIQSSNIFQWHLDYPRSGTALSQQVERLKIQGWVTSCNGEQIQVVADSSYGSVSYELSERRCDVIRKILGQDPALVDIMCGFNFELDDWRGGITLGFRIAGTVYRILTIKIVSTIKVEEGVEGWLFLGNDSNRSIDQYTGNLVLNNTDLHAWENYFKKIHDLANELAFQWLFVLAPAKEFVYPEYYPYERGALLAVDQFLDKFSQNEKILWPITALRNAKEQSYWKGDTHWTDYGASIVNNEISNFFSFSLSDETKVKYTILQRAGDLGGKFSPKRIFPVATADFFSVRERIVFDNGVHNHGCIRVYEQPDFPEDRSCIVFGDSFSANLVPWIVLQFKRLVFVHSASAFDQELIKFEQPTHVILQTNSRFIIIPPNSLFSIREVLRKKFKSVNSMTRDEYIEKFNNYNFQSSSFYTSLMIESLHNC